MTNKLRVGLIGCGGIANGHLYAYSTLPDMFELVALADIDPTLAQAKADVFGIQHVYADLESLLAHDGLDVVDICTPSNLHVAQSIQTMEAGKAVICEKPIAQSLAEVDQIAASVEATGQTFMPIFNYRFGHSVLRLHHLIECGLAGTPYLGTVETAWLRGDAYFSHHWRGTWAGAMGGGLITHAIHAHDLLYTIMGPAKSIFARAKTLVNPVEIEDTVSVSLEMANGALVSLSVTLGSAVEITRHRYCFQNLVAESNLDPYASNTENPWQFTGTTPELDGQIQAALADFSPTLPQGFAGQFYRFHQALETGGPLPVTLQDARESLELLTAMYYSAATGQPVDLPIPEDHPMYNGWIAADGRGPIG